VGEAIRLGEDKTGGSGGKLGRILTPISNFLCIIKVKFLEEHGKGVKVLKPSPPGRVWMKLRRWTVFESAFINKWQAEAEVLEICHLRAFTTCLYPCKLGIGLGLGNLLTHSKHPAGLTSSRIAHQDSA